MVALKVKTAESSGKTQEIEILRSLRQLDVTSNGLDHMLQIRDGLRREGPNGTHEILITELIGTLYDLRDYRLMKSQAHSLARQVLIGLDHIHRCGITHGG